MERVTQYGLPPKPLPPKLVAEISRIIEKYSGTVLPEDTPLHEWLDQRLHNVEGDLVYLRQRPDLQIWDETIRDVRMVREALKAVLANSEWKGA